VFVGDPPTMPMMPMMPDVPGTPAGFSLAAAGQQPVPQEPAPPHALVVDDDDDLRTSLRYLLEMEGYEVEEARDGLEALDRLRTSEQALVVLLDLMMPRLNGMEVLNAVAADERLAERHAYLIVTANRDKIQPPFSGLLRRLDVPVVMKPYDVDEILAVVAKITRRLQS
jgi:CheY-like chemotaxis protein